MEKDENDEEFSETYGGAEADPGRHPDCGAGANYDYSSDSDG